MDYIKEELEGIKKNQMLLVNKLQNDELSFFGKQTGKEAMKILSKAVEVLEKRENIKKIDDLINALPVLYIHISEIE